MILSGDGCLLLCVCKRAETRGKKERASERGAERKEEEEEAQLNASVGAAIGCSLSCVCLKQRVEEEEVVARKGGRKEGGGQSKDMAPRVGYNVQYNGGTRRNGLRSDGLRLSTKDRMGSCNRLHCKIFEVSRAKSNVARAPSRW